MLDRRQLLTSVAAAAALAACTDDGGPDPAVSRSPLTPHPDHPALLAAIAREEELLAAYAAVSGPAVALVRQHHQEHLAELSRAQRSLLPHPRPTATGTTSESPSAAPAQPRSLTTLAGLERRAAVAGLTTIPGWTEGSVAALVASIAASEAQHAQLLAGLA